MLIIAIFAASSLSSTDIIQVELAPGTTFAVDYSPFSDGDVDIDVTNGLAQVYTFDSQPSIADTVDSFQTETGNLPISGDYNWFGISLGEGTEVIVDWSASGSITYYAIRGDSNLNSWVDGNDNQFYSDFGMSGSHTYTVSRSDTYYFAVEASSFGNVDYTLNFEFGLPVHNLVNPNNQWSGSNYIAESEMDGNSIVFYNPSSSMDASVTVTIASNFSFGQVFLTIIIVAGGALYLIKRSSDKKNKSTTTPQTSADPGLALDQKNDPLLPEKPAKSLGGEKQFISRAPAKYCSNCGSGLMPDSKFCIECGQAA